MIRLRYRRGRRKGKHFSQRGVALIAVATALTMTAILAKEFATDTQIDAFGADNARDQMRAEMLARSSMNLSEMILRLQQVLDAPDVAQQIGAIQITDYADMFMQAFGGTPEEVASATGLAGDEARGLGADIGAFGVKITSDDGKINLNCANGKREYAGLAYTLLDALYYFPAFDPVFEEETSDKWRRDRRQQTEAIMDYIDEDQSRAVPAGEPSGSGGTEDYGYDGLDDGYKAKNNYLDTLDEAKLIRGVDDRFWTLFSPAFTVYGGCKLNVRAIEDPRLIAAIIFLSADENDPVVRDGNLLWMHAQAAVWARQNGFFFDKPEDFIEFMKDPVATIGAGLTGTGEDGTGAGTGGTIGGAQAAQFQIPGVPPGVKLGVELKAEEVNKVLRAGPQRTYRLEVWGEVTRHPPFMPVRRTMTAVWDMGTVNINQRSTEARARNGAWVYLRKH